MGLSLTHLGAEILWIQEFLDPSLCQHLIQVAETYGFAQAGIEVARLDAQIRSNDLLDLGSDHPLLASTNQLLLTKVRQIQTLLHEYYGIAFPHAEACSILRYRQGQFYRRHVDNLLLSSRLEEAQQSLPTRDISIVGYLNDDFEGGTTWFDRQNLEIKPQTGSVIIFPAYYTHPHQSLPVTRGQKYAFTTWLFH
ncbi:2OG-Fe(II) oxygenase [Trichothermofontia sichuanensis B231]|uniref:prolyl hydroxylase family protein n=1 Tax=Trichothermofontia sichuanensis TaxID=3045816 RepID=UPI0022473922|nr:2OG-Fe(II) oxygenase [Trichothermofontia sichuanensis]UZQ53894.1 2OG-Fe(II) oxygenase [Trichothermofontia sichuanensis B231]